MKQSTIKIRISFNHTDAAHYFCVDYFEWTSSYYEQPSIMHLNEFLIYLQTDTQVYGIGSTKGLNDFMSGTSE